MAGKGGYNIGRSMRVRMFNEEYVYGLIEQLKIYVDISQLMQEKDL